MSDELCTVASAEDNVDINGDFPCAQLLHQWLRSFGTEEPHRALITSCRTSVAVNSIRALIGIYNKKLREPTTQDDTHTPLRRRLRNARAYLQEQLLRHRHLYTFLQEIKSTRPKPVSTWLAFRHYNHFIFRNFLRPDPKVNTEELSYVFLIKLENVVNALVKEDKTQFYVRVVVLLREYVDIAVENYVNYVDPCDKNRHSSYMACILSYYSAFISATLKLYYVLGDFSEFMSERFRMSWYLFNQRIFYQYFYLRPEVQVRVPEFYQMYKETQQPGLINLLRSYTLFVENMNRLDNHWKIQRKRIDVINDRNMAADKKWVEKDWMMYEEVRRISKTNYWLVRSEHEKAIQDMEELDSHILEMLCSSWETGDRVITLAGTCICEDCMLVEFSQMILPPNHRLRNNSRCTLVLQGDSALYAIPVPVKEVLTTKYERPVIRLTMCSICEEAVLLNAYSKHIVSNHPPTEEDLEGVYVPTFVNSGSDSPTDEYLEIVDVPTFVNTGESIKEAERTREEACIDNHTSLIVVDKKLKSTNFVSVPMDSPHVQYISSGNEENKLVQIALPPSLSSSVKALHGMSRSARYIESTLNDPIEEQQNKNSFEDQSRNKLFSINPPLHKHVLPDKCSLCLQINGLSNSCSRSEGIKDLHCLQCCKVKEPLVITLFPTANVSTLDTNLRPYSTLTSSSYSSSPSERDDHYDSDSDSTNSEMIVILKNHKDCDQPNNHDVHIRRVARRPRKNGLQINMKMDSDSTQTLATEVVDAAVVNGLQPISISTVQRNAINRIAFEEETVVDPPYHVVPRAPLYSPSILEEDCGSSSDGGPLYIDISDEDFENPTQEPRRLLPEMKSASLSDDDLREVEPFRPDSCWKLIYPDLELEPEPPCPFLEEIASPDAEDLSGTVIIPALDEELHYQYLQSRANVSSPKVVRLCAPSIRLDANGSAPGFWLSTAIAEQLTSNEIGEDPEELFVDAHESNSTLPEFPNEDAIGHSDGLDDCIRLFQAFVRDADRTNKMTKNRYLAQMTHFSNVINDDVYFEDVDSDAEESNITQSSRNARASERLSDVWGEVDGRWDSMEEMFRSVTPLLEHNFSEVVLQEVEEFRAVTQTVDREIDEMSRAITPTVDQEVNEIFRVVTPTVNRNVNEIVLEEVQIFRSVTPTKDQEENEIFRAVTPMLDQEVDEIFRAVIPTVDQEVDEIFRAVTPKVNHNVNQIVLQGFQLFRARSPVSDQEADEIFPTVTPVDNEVDELFFRAVIPTVDQEVNELLFRTITPTVDDEIEEIFPAVTPIVNEQMDEIFRAIIPTVDQEVNELLFRTVIPTVDQEIEQIFPAVTPIVNEQMDEIFRAETSTVDNETDELLFPTVNHAIDEIFQAVTPTVNEEMDEILRSVPPTVSHNEVNILEEDEHEDEIPDYVTGEDLSIVNDEFTKQLMKILQEADGLTMPTEAESKDGNVDKTDANSEDQSAHNLKIRRNRLQEIRSRNEAERAAQRARNLEFIRNLNRDMDAVAAKVSVIDHSAEVLRSARVAAYQDAAAASAALAAISKGAGAAAVVALGSDRGEQLIVKIAENLGSAGTSLFTAQTNRQDSKSTTSTTSSGKQITTPVKSNTTSGKPIVTSGKSNISSGKPIATLRKPVVTSGKPVATSGKPVASLSSSGATPAAVSGAIPKAASRIYSKRTQLRAARNRDITEPESCEYKQHNIVAEIEKSYNEECQDALVWPIMDAVERRNMVVEDDRNEDAAWSTNFGGVCKLCETPFSTEQHMDCLRLQTSKGLAKALKKQRQKEKREEERKLRQQRSNEMRERQHELAQQKREKLEKEKRQVELEIQRLEEKKRIDREKEAAKKAALRAEQQREIEKRQEQSRNDKAREAAKKLAAQQALDLKNKKIVDKSSQKANPGTITKSKKRRNKKAASSANKEVIKVPCAPKLPSVDDDNSSYEPWSSDEFGNSDDVRKSFAEEKSDSSDSESPAQTRTPTQHPVTEELPAMIRIVRGDAPSTVTISLKGITPEQDKLLYTLVNGQAEIAEPPQELTAAATAALLPMPDMSVLENPNLTKKQRKKKTQQLNKKVAKVSAVNASLSQSTEEINILQLPVTREAKITLAVDQNLRTVKAGGEVKCVQHHNPPNNQEHISVVGAATIKLPENFNLPPGITITPVAQPIPAFIAPSQEQRTSTGAIRKTAYTQISSATYVRNPSVSNDVICNNKNRVNVVPQQSQRPKQQEQPQQQQPLFSFNQSPGKVPYVPFYMTQPKTGSPIVLDTEKLIKEGAIKKKRKSKKKHETNCAAIVVPALHRHLRRPRHPPRSQMQVTTEENAQRITLSLAPTPAPEDQGVPENTQVEEGNPTDEPKMITLKNPLFQQPEPSPPFVQPPQGMQPLEQSQQDQLSVQLSEQATIYKGLPVTDTIGETMSMTAFLREQQPPRQPARDWNTYSLFSNPTPSIPPDIDIVDIAPNLHSTSADRPSFGGNIANYQPDDVRASEPHPWMNLLSTLPEEIEVTTVERPGPSSHHRNSELQHGASGLSQYETTFSQSDYHCSNTSLFSNNSFGPQYDTASQLPAHALDRSALNIPDVTLFNSSGLGMPLNDIMPQYTDTTALEQALALLNVAVAPTPSVNVLSARVHAAHSPTVSAAAHHDPETSYSRASSAPPLRLNPDQAGLATQLPTYPMRTMPSQNSAQSARAPLSMPVPSLSGPMLYDNEEPQYDWINQAAQTLDENANQNRRSIWHEDNVFAPKESFDDGELDPIDRDVEAFKLFCLQSIPPKKKEKVIHLNVHDIVLKSKNKK